MLDIALVGTSGMMPLKHRWLAAGAVRYKGHTILIDCGEGTQVPFRGLGWGLADVDAILFTHYHADHIAGLPGMLLTLGNGGKVTPLVLVGPPQLREIVCSLMVIVSKLPYEIQFIEVNGDATPFELCEITVRSLAVAHGMPCVSYNFEIKRQGEFSVDRAKELKIPMKMWSKLQKGEVISYNGFTYRPEMVLGPERKGLKISYCTDTRPTDNLVYFIQSSDLFICEGMYGDDLDYEKAVAKGHMTFRESAMLAKAGNVKEMWLTHFSPALTYPDNYVNIAKTIFSNTHIGKDMQTKTLKFRD